MPRELKTGTPYQYRYWTHVTALCLLGVVILIGAQLTMEYGISPRQRRDAHRWLQRAPFQLKRLICHQTSLRRASLLRRSPQQSRLQSDSGQGGPQERAPGSDGAGTGVRFNTHWRVSLKDFGSSVEVKGPAGRLAVVGGVVATRGELLLHLWYGGDASTKALHTHAVMPRCYTSDRAGWVRSLQIDGADSKFPCSPIPYPGNDPFNTVVRCQLDDASIATWLKLSAAAGAPGPRSAHNLNTDKAYEAGRFTLRFLDGSGVERELVFMGRLDDIAKASGATIALGNGITSNWDIYPRHYAEWLLYHRAIGFEHAVIVADGTLDHGIIEFFDRFQEHYPGFLTVIPRRPWSMINPNGDLPPAGPKYFPDQSAVIEQILFDRYADDWLAVMVTKESPHAQLTHLTVLKHQDLDEFLDLGTGADAAMNVRQEVDKAMCTPDTAGFEVPGYFFSWRKRDFVTKTEQHWGACFTKTILRPSRVAYAETHNIYPLPGNDVDWIPLDNDHMHLHHIRVDTDWFQPDSTPAQGRCGNVITAGENGGIYTDINTLVQGLPDPSAENDSTK